MNRVTSPDGTSIAYDRQGDGPAVILVTGGLDDGSENAPLAAELAQHNFTVYNFARRGRAASGDTLPYAVEREIEDVEALITEAGGIAHLYGVSSGGGLVLEAAATGVAADKLAVYEVPYGMPGDTRWQAYAEALTPLLAENRRGDAIALFMRLAGSSEEDIAGARAWEGWPGLEALAHTLAYDAACMGGDYQVPASRFARITRPALITTGTVHDPHMAGLSPTFFSQAADAITAALPTAHRHAFEGQSHVADPKAVAPVLARFFSG